MHEKIAVIGLGYVGLALALALAKKFPGHTIGFDISQARVEALRRGHDWSNEQSTEELNRPGLVLTTDAKDLAGATFFIVTVPTPVDAHHKPDLSPLRAACNMLGAVLKWRGAAQTPVVVFESTVYPGLTEEICGAALEAASGLKRGVDFRLGYSPERINPGDPARKLESIVKVIAAEDGEALARMERVYSVIITAGLYRAPSIAVAEAAKVIENTQRDLNVALMNELALICDRMNIRTKDVLEAAGTKWNFVRFTPGLVGGHCIGVDPYYLTTRAEALGLRPQVILAGRHINDSMGAIIGDKINTWLRKQKKNKPRVGILGLTFKENVRDLRNSRVPDIVQEVRKCGADILVHDPMVDEKMAEREYGLQIAPRLALQSVDVLVLAVPHPVFMEDLPSYLELAAADAFIVDIKSIVNPASLPTSQAYWSL